MIWSSTWSSVSYGWSGGAFLIFAALPIMWGFSYLWRYRRHMLRTYASAEVLYAASIERNPTVYWLKTGLFTAAWICAVLALMQPQIHEGYVQAGQPLQVSKKVPLRMRMHDVFLLIDTSASMAIPDGYGGLQRLEIAKQIADNVISDLRGQSVALLTFTSAVSQIVPLNMDYLFTRLMLRHVSINEGGTGGTNIENALQTLSKKDLVQYPSVTKTVILLSDGGDTSLYGLKGAQLRQAIDKVIHPIASLHSPRVHVYTVGIGSKKGEDVPGVQYEGHPVLSAVEEELLRMLSIVGHGAYWYADNIQPFLIAQALSRVIASEDSFVTTQEQAPQVAAGVVKVDYLFQRPLGIALALLLCYLLIPDALGQKKREIA